MNLNKNSEIPMQTYHYVGEVIRFGKVVMDNFECATMAKSEAQALNNIKFKAKQKLGYERTAVITLNPSKLKLIPTRVKRNRY